MNKKGKNKRNKNNPAHNEEAKIEEKNEEAIEIVESVKERVPEIVSETATPVVEIQDDVPRKPKRNRGKKKKDDDEETVKEENLEEVTTLPVETLVEQPAEIITVVPTTRKKKNKKKGNDLTEQPAKENAGTVLKERSADELQYPDVKGDITQSLPILEEKEVNKPELQEVKTSKKKNKKKNRNDSENFDMEVSCTTASQKILDDTMLAEKTEDKGSDQQLLGDKPLAPDIIEVRFEENKDSDIPKNITAPAKIEISSNYEKEAKEISKPDSQSKKKNKKDKKQAKSEDTQKIELQIDKQTNKPTNVEVLTESKTAGTKNIITEPLDTSVEELSLKAEAKIAKPVEKERRDRLDTKDNTENMCDPTKSEKTDPANETIKTNEEATIEVIDIPLTSEQFKEDNKDRQELIIPDNAMGKKRKKSPKMKKKFESSNSKDQITNIESESKQSDIDYKIICLPVEIVAATCTEKTCTKSDDLNVKPLQEDTTKLSAETNMQLLSSDLTQAKDTAEDKLTKHKPGKKRKKSPKPTTNPEEIKAELVKHDSVDCKVIEDQPVSEPLDIKESKKEKNETPKLDVIEIRSLKGDESEGSACDVSPDILYPRSTSQQHFDDNNNNMVIRELMPTENILDMPIVLGCVDTPKTPEPTPEKNIVEDSLKSVEPFKMRKISNNVNANIAREEKTDLKSKMMEVNQDMEELRLSIEKSLAGFTAIEISEATVEKQFEEDKKTAEIKTEKILDVTETPIQQLKSKEVTHDKLGESSKDKADDRNNIKDASELSKDKTKHLISEPKAINPPQIAEIIEAASLGNEKSSKTQDVTRIGETILIETLESVAPITQKKTEQSSEKKESEVKAPEEIPSSNAPPICPARKDHKGKPKKKKGKPDNQTTAQSSSTTGTTNTTTPTTESKDTKETKRDNKTESKSDNQEKGKQQADIESSDIDYDAIENFEDALTSSVDDVNNSFEMIVNDGNDQTNPKINIIAPDDEKINKVQPSKNLLGHPDIPVQSNNRDYKKEKNKTPNESQAKVKIKDAINIEKNSKNTQTINKIIKNSKNDTLRENEAEEYVYKYSFRKVFLQSACHVCKKELNQRVACAFCNLVFYCSVKHKDEDWPQHQALCFAVSTIAHLKDQKHIYSDVQNITGHDYRLARMQMIVSCEKVLKRRLVPWEQEALLYPRVCALVSCREWRQGKLKDCEGCGQISYCAGAPDHLSKTHQRWCKSYSLYQKLVSYQQSKGRLEPKLPGRVMQEEYQMPEKINEVLASMYEEKIDMNDIQYAALTQIATAPLTAAYSYQTHKNKLNATSGTSKKSSFTIHVVGAELQFEADALNKWEVFFLHLRPDLKELTVVLVNSNLNPSNLPLELLGKINLCETCVQEKRRVVFHFQDKKSYAEYRTSDEYVQPDLVCAFNPSIQRASVYNGKDSWPSTIKTILKLKTPWLVTAYTMTELQRDTIRIKECTETPYRMVSEPKLNSFASVRPDRNFISDDEIPLLFKNYCYAILCGISDPKSDAYILPTTMPTAYIESMETWNPTAITPSYILSWLPKSDAKVDSVIRPFRIVLVDF